MGELTADEPTAAAIVTAPAADPREEATVADERPTSAAPADAVTAPVRRELDETGEKDLTAGTNETVREGAEDDRLAVAPEAAVLAPARPERAETLAPAEEPAETEATAEEETPSVPDEVLLVPGATEYAPGVSPTAPRRPGNLLARNEAAKEDAVNDATNLVVAAAASPFQIQLAADPDRDSIINMWKRISNANQDVLNGRALSIQTTESGGTTFFRLRVGPFDGRAEAASVCQALKARSQDCIVARNL